MKIEHPGAVLELRLDDPLRLLRQAEAGGTLKGFAIKRYIRAGSLGYANVSADWIQRFSNDVRFPAP